MSDTFIANRKEDLKQLGYLLKHKEQVFRAGRQLGLPIGQLFKHDLSKFSPKEWKPYREYLVDKQRRSGDYEAFREAVEKDHYPRNKHQVKHWKNLQTMPNRYQLEALADWYSVNKIHGHTNATFPNWIKQHLTTLPVTDTTKEMVLKKLGFKQI